MEKKEEKRLNVGGRRPIRRSPNAGRPSRPTGNRPDNKIARPAKQANTKVPLDEFSDNILGDINFDSPEKAQAQAQAQTQSQSQTKSRKLFNPNKNTASASRRPSPSPRNRTGGIRQVTGKKPMPSKRPAQTKPQVVVSHKVNKTEDVLKIIPIGGCEEVGRNMTIFEYKGDVIILDMGLQFPEENMPGIDYIIPNVDYLKGREKDVKGVIFSHGHLDHIGAAPILLEKLGNPLVVGRSMTLSMIKHRLEDYKKGSSKDLKSILIKNISDVIKMGPFKVKFFQIEHSIMDAVGVVIETPHGNVIHPGDWTLERDDSGKPLVDYSHLAKVPSPKILMLESLGATDVRKSASTEDMKKNLKKLISEAKGRVIIGTFSSQVERIAYIIETAQKLGKKIILDGYSMKMNIEIAQKLGYVKAAKGTLIKMEQLGDFPDSKIVVLCTGAQGESNAVLSRITDGSHRFIKLQRNDTIVFSSSVIPGNERTIQTLKDNLYRQCDNVIHGEIMDIHVSGHGNRDDIKYLLQTIKPDYYIPVYAYHYMLAEAAKLAVSIGFDEKKIFVPDNGSIIEFDKKGTRIGKVKAPSDYIFVDGLGVTDSHNVILRDRQLMAGDGMLVVIATLSRKTGNLIHNPDLISRGFVYMKENKKLIEMTRAKTKKILKDHDPKTSADSQLIREKLRNELGKFLFKKTEKRPMILPVLIEV